MNCHLMLPGPKGVAKSAFQLRGAPETSRNAQKSPATGDLVLLVSTAGCNKKAAAWDARAWRLRPLEGFKRGAMTVLLC